jgi:hypothetical protein
MIGIMKSKFLISAGLLALLCALLPPRARADGTGLEDVTITLPTISGSAGDAVKVFGTLTNTSSNTLDFANDSVTFNNNTVLGGAADAATNAILSLGPSSIGGNSMLTGVDLFTVFIASDAAPGLYNVNFYDLLGGTDANCTISPSLCGVQLGTVEFTVNVQGTMPTPEPGTFVLLASAFLVGLLVIRRSAQ